MCLTAHTDIDTHMSTKNGTVYVLEGKGTFTLEGETIALSPGSLTVTLSSGLRVWSGDTNNDGTGDTPIANVTLTLFDAAGVPLGRRVERKPLQQRLQSGEFRLPTHQSTVLVGRAHGIHGKE